eukprot:jgi/Tetstr1/421651/TSEL_012591.t1
METAFNLCEWKLTHNIKTAAFERLSKLLKKYMLPKDGDWTYDDRCPRYNLTRWTPESLDHPHPATPQPHKFYYDFNVCEVSRHAFIKSGKKRNKMVLIIIPWPFTPKHIDIYVDEETLKAIA